MKRLHLHIERLVVEGIPPSAQRRFMRALEMELRTWAESASAAEVLARDPVSQTGTSRASKRIRGLDAGQLRPGATAEQAAARVAGSIRRGILADRASPESTLPATVRGAPAKTLGEAHCDV